MIGPHIVAMPDDASPLERDYLEALQRIVAGIPRSARLAESAKRGPLRPSQSHVAEEAGRSRTPLTGRDPALPRVQEALEAALVHWASLKRPVSATEAVARRVAAKDLTAICTALRENNTILKRERDAAFTSDVGMTLLAKALEKEIRSRNPDLVEARRRAESLSLDT